MDVRHALFVCLFVCFVLQAVECNQIDCVKLLLDARADTAMKDRAGNACLHYAAHYGFHDIMALLLQHVQPALLHRANHVSLHFALSYSSGCLIYLLWNIVQAVHIKEK